MYTLSNDKISISVSPVGAQLCSLYAKETEYLWQPGYETWSHSSMLLFPNPGRIAHGRTIIGGKVYPANMHGFANDLPFELVEESAEKLVLQLQDNEITKKYYPYSFCLQVEFLLSGDTLIQNFRVINKGSDLMCYCLGAHPGFYCPLMLGEQAEDYSLVFDTPQKLYKQELEENTRLLTGNKRVYLDNTDEIPLHDHFFDDGPMLFEGVAAKTITLQSKKSGRFVEMGIEGFPNMCLWGVPTRMSLIAIEPWIGTSDRADTNHIWEEKPGIQKIETAQTHTLTFRMG